MMRDQELDPVGLAVLSKQLEALVRTMQTTLVKTGRSGVLNTAKDCSCCLLSAKDDMVAIAESLPCHVMSGPDLQAKSMRELHPEFRPGDAFLHNSPYHGNSHAADHCILVPIFSPDGKHRFTAYVKAHQADCGNAIPTTYSTSARDVYEEGALIFPCVRVQEDYTDCDDILRMCRQRIRVPDQWWGDYLAMIGAARIGEKRVLALGEEYGWDALEDYVEQWLDYSERRMVAALAEVPSGRVTYQTRHDPTPEIPEGVPISVSVDVRAQEGRVEIDLTDNPDCLPCGLNLTEATSRAGALLGLFFSIDHTVPQNTGSARRVEIKLRENCCVGIPRHPVSCSVGTTNLLDRVANAVAAAVSELGAEVGRAETGYSFPMASAVISGHDPRHDGAPFVNQMFLGWTGGAGGPRADGWLTNCGVGDGGVMTRDSIELNELRFPIMIWRDAVVPDSEGAGQFRGAPAVVVEYGPVDTEMEIVFASDGSVHPAQGARGGAAGAGATQVRVLDGEDVEKLDGFALVRLGPGEVVRGTSSAGGGYGDPFLRHPERVAFEVREGWITDQRAREVYGVAVAADGALDVEATRALRAGAPVTVA